MMRPSAFLRVYGCFSIWRPYGIGYHYFRVSRTRATSSCATLEKSGKHMTANLPVIKPIRLNSASHQLQKASVLRALIPRREPYWAAPLSRGRFVGLRKIDMLRATWIARLRDDAGKQKYKSIGLVTTEFGFDQAKAAAAGWF